jgi:5-deoxy-5-amino-3-dehydroquinate synthase
VKSIPVALGDRSYDVVVGRGAHTLVGEVLPAAVQRVAIVTQEGIDVDIDAGVPADVVLVPAGEGAKTLSQVEELCRDFARRGLSRSDAVVAVGGGVVSDLAGFAAAVFLRGIAYVTVATTLLAQVDAAIGGKTGVNLPEGKNLVGAFWQPSAVLCDVDLLSTLPAREWASGRGEMAKYAFLGRIPPRGSRAHPCSISPSRTRWRAAWPSRRRWCHPTSASRTVAWSSTTGTRWPMPSRLPPSVPTHAGISATVKPWPSGLVFAAQLAQRLGRIDDARVALHRKVVGGFDLSADMPAGATAGQLLSFMARDKKARHDLTFVLDGPDGVEPGARGERGRCRGHPDRDGLRTVTGSGT